MRVVADTHTHYYPEYDSEIFWPAAVRHLRGLAERHAQAAKLALFMTERHDCHAFEAWAEGPLAEATPVPWCLKIPVKLESLYVVAGRQMATAERLEVLALCSTATTEMLPDGLSLSESIAAVRAVGGIAVLPWAPGKWLGERGKLLAKTLEEDPALLLSDSATRPWGWRKPKVFSGRSVLAGTDPYPIQNQEGLVGRYASIWDVPGDFGVARLRDLLSEPSRTAGHRKGPWRWIRDMAAMR